MSQYRLTAAAIMTLLIGGGLIFYEQPKSVKVERPKTEIQQVHGFGIIDLEQIQEKLLDSKELKSLRGKEIRLRLELDEVMRPVEPLQLPEIDTTPFDESAREKNMQNIIGQLAELKARRKRLAAEYERNTEQDYIERRNAIREFYLNEAFNITLKIQNADVLHLTPDEVGELQKQLDDLVMERNDKQRELFNNRNDEIASYVAAKTADEEARIKRESQDTLQKYSVEAQQKAIAAQERNRALMEAASKEVAARQIRRREILDELTKTSEDRAELENKILDSIANQAGKLGAMYKLEAVLIKRNSAYYEKDFFNRIKFSFKLDAPKSPGAIIVAGTDTVDLTKDLIKALSW